METFSPERFANLPSSAQKDIWDRISRYEQERNERNALIVAKLKQLPDSFHNHLLVCIEKYEKYLQKKASLKENEIFCSNCGEVVHRNNFGETSHQYDAGMGPYHTCTSGSHPSSFVFSFN